MECFAGATGSGRFLRTAVNDVFFHFAVPLPFHEERFGMRWFYLVALLVAAALVASPMVFLGDELEEQHPEGILSWNTYGSAVKSIDPATCGDVSSASIQANFYESLYTYHYLKRPLEVIPQLAAGMPEVSDDGLTYTIRLTPGVLYHRNICFGTEPSGKHQWSTRTVRAEDFVLAFKRIADYHINTGLAWAFLAGRIEGLDAFRQRTKHYKAGDFSRYDLEVEGLQAPDSLTLQLHLTSPFPQLKYVLAMSVYAPIPRELVDYWLTTAPDGKGGRRPLPPHERNAEIMEPEMVVGTGPYLLDTWKRKWKIILERNAEFRQEYYPCEGEPSDSALGILRDCGKKVPFIDHIHYRFIEEQYATWMLFLSGQLDAGGIPRETFDEVITPDQDLSERWRKRNIALKVYTQPTVYWIVFNMEDEVLGASKSLRQALCLGYDVESQIEVLYNGRGKRAVNVVPSSFKGHEKAGPGPYYRYDLDAAKAKLDDARKELAAAGLLENGRIPELTIDMVGGAGEASAARYADFMRQQFAQLGLRLKVVFNDWPTLQRKVHNKNVQMYTMGWHADYPDAENFLQLYYSGNIDKGTNNSNYSNPVFDSLYEKVRVMQDTPERTAIYARMINILSEDCPALLTMEPVSYVLIYDWLRNVKPHPVGYGYTKYRRLNTRMRAEHGGRS